MLIAIGKCQACGETSRRDYTLTEPVVKIGWHGPIETGELRYWRTNTWGRRVSAACDDECPVCHAQRWKGKPVKTAHSATVCNAACTHATSLSCKCSCGGANHGAVYLVCEEIAEAA
jgi:hypothetical protein